MLSYFTAAFGFLSFVLYGSSPLTILALALAPGAFGIANEKRWGYVLAIVAAGLYGLLCLYIAVSWHYLGILVTLAFTVALVALLLHPQSREYQRIWFH
jgi:hypothetical protein